MSLRIHDIPLCNTYPISLIHVEVDNGVDDDKSPVQHVREYMQLCLLVALVKTLQIKII